eukprot:921377-Prymnesium_polylepis.1
MVVAARLCSWRRLAAASMVIDRDVWCGGWVQSSVCAHRSKLVPAEEEIGVDGAEPEDGEWEI